MHMWVRFIYIIWLEKILDFKSLIIFNPIRLPDVSFSLVFQWILSERRRQTVIFSPCFDEVLCQTNASRWACDGHLAVSWSIDWIGNLDLSTWHLSDLTDLGSLAADDATNELSQRRAEMFWKAKIKFHNTSAAMWLQTTGNCLVWSSKCIVHRTDWSSDIIRNSTACLFIKPFVDLLKHLHHLEWSSHGNRLEQKCPSLTNMKMKYTTEIHLSMHAN